MCRWATPAFYTLVMGRRRTAREVAIKRQYGVMNPREVLVEKVKLRAALVLFVVTEEENNEDEK